MDISDKLFISGQKVLLVGFRSHQNMGDELILLGNIKLLLNEGKDIFVVAYDPKWLKTFLTQFIDINSITFIQELPRGFRSWIKYIKTYGLKQIPYFLDIDTVILGGGEVLTEESPHSYYYRFRSIRPALLFKKTLYLMGGIQVPQKKINKILFNLMTSHTKKILVRDKEEIANIKRIGFDAVSFFMDTSYFAIQNRASYKQKIPSKYIIININTKGLPFIDEICKEIISYAKLGYKSKYIAVCQGASDNDNNHFVTIKKHLPKEYKNSLTLLDRSSDFLSFLECLGGAKKIICTRLHLFLISSFIGLDTMVFPYQKKIKKMEKIIQEYF